MVDDIIGDDDAEDDDDDDSSKPRRREGGGGGGSSARGTTIIDAGCGAGNLAISLAGLLRSSNHSNVVVVDEDDGGPRGDEGEGEGEGGADDLHRPRPRPRRRRRRNNRDRDVRILAVDVNEVALDRLSRRAAGMPGVIRTLRADLADYDLIRSCVPPGDDVVVVSLHACGAASDMAMELAYRCDGAPFVICPCCTAKSLARRRTTTEDAAGDAVVARRDGGDDCDDETCVDDETTTTTTTTTTITPRFFHLASSSSSRHRSGATVDIEYPRSVWLRDRFSSVRRRGREVGDHSDGGGDGKGGGLGGGRDDDDGDDGGDDGMYYALLAKVADVGLGPQTPSQQREHQRRAKRIVELDRAMRAVERHGYVVRLARIPSGGDDGVGPWGYGKGEVLVGARRGSAAAANILSIFDADGDGPSVDDTS